MTLNKKDYTLANGETVTVLYDDRDICQVTKECMELLIGLYQQGRADYEAECEKIFDDNPPMHFSTEQIMWIKEYIKHARASERADAIEEHFRKIMSFINTNNRGSCDYFIVDQIENYIAEQLKEQNK